MGPIPLLQDLNHVRNEISQRIRRAQTALHNMRSALVTDQEKDASSLPQPRKFNVHDTEMLLKLLDDAAQNLKEIDQ